MQYVKEPTEVGFYWFKRPPYIKGFWWQKKTKITPGWEMCFVNTVGLRNRFAVKVGPTKTFSFDTEGEWYGPLSEPEGLYLLVRDHEDLALVQAANLERARTD